MQVILDLFAFYLSSFFSFHLSEMGVCFTILDCETTS